MAAADVAWRGVHDESIRFPGLCHSIDGSSCSESIMIYLSVAGYVIPERILESDSIASVKLRIQMSKGFEVKKQKLVFAGRELARNDSLVKNYGVADGDVLHLVLKLSDLLGIVVKTVSGKELEFHVERGRNVAYLKHRIAEKENGPVDLENQELFCNGEKLEDRTIISDICMNTGAVIHLLVQKSAKVRAKPLEKDFELLVEAADFGKPPEELQVAPKEPVHRDFNFILEAILVNPRVTLPPDILNMVNSTLEGLEGGNLPVKSSEGSGGTYLMPDVPGLKYVSVFKPIDEEPNAVNNPQGLTVSANGEGLKRGTKVGEGALREVAVYLLDHPRSGPRLLSGEVMGFAGVPPTIMVQCLHKGFNHPNGYKGTLENLKTGSLQMFRKNFGSCEDIGPGAFPVEEVHKISVLDIRMANADRHSGNMLLSKDEQGRIQLIPIDNGYCLPEIFEDCTFDWLYWPQARQPYSPDTIYYIKSLEAEKDIDLLQFFGCNISPESARTLRISTMLLKKGVERGLTPFAIGSIMCRETMNKESVIEEIVNEAFNSSLPGDNEAMFLETVSDIMDSRLDKLAN